MNVWGLTDKGITRSENQDAYMIDALSSTQMIMAVCDGMGGAKAGNIASEMAIAYFHEYLKINSNLLCPKVK